MPDIAPKEASWITVKVHSDRLLQFEKCHYSVRFSLTAPRPLAAAKTDYGPDLPLVAAIPRLHEPGTRSTSDDHLPPEAIEMSVLSNQCLKEHIPDIESLKEQVSA